jgi:hypothetical protein
MHAVYASAYLTRAEIYDRNYLLTLTTGVLSMGRLLALLTNFRLCRKGQNGLAYFRRRYQKISELFSDESGQVESRKGA